MFDPFSRSQGIGHGKLDPITVPFSFVEEVKEAILLNNIAINTGFTIFRYEEHFWFRFKIGKIFIRIGIIDDVRTIPMLHGPIDHIFSCCRIKDCLWRPYALQIFLPTESLLEINGPV
ncbi:hypothetical protein D3C86_1940950 [compost metagenome]